MDICTNHYKSENWDLSNIEYHDMKLLNIRKQNLKHIILKGFWSLIVRKIDFYTLTLNTT